MGIFIPHEGELLIPLEVSRELVAMGTEGPLVPIEVFKELVAMGM